MAIKVKWDVDGKGEAAWGGDGQTYSGPIPPKGSYVAKIKRMTLGKIAKEGPNKGKPRLSVLLEIVSGQGAESIDDKEYKYRGAPVWDGVNIIKSQAGRANMFAHSLTDGSDKAKRAVENKFWPPNMDIRAERVDRRDGGTDIHIKSIGQYKINSPNGETLVRITTKMGKDLEKNARAEVSQYLPYTGPMPGANNGKNVTDDEDEEEELLEEDEDEDEELDVEDEDEYEEVDDDEPVGDDEPPF